MFLVCAALLVGVVCCALLPSGVEARSNGQLIASGCDLSPQLGWPNGRFGRNKTGAGNAGITIGVDSGIMRSARPAEQQPHTTTTSMHTGGELSRCALSAVTGPQARARLTLTDCMRILCWLLDGCLLLLLCCCCSVVGSLVCCLCRWTDAPVASTFYTIRSGDSAVRTADPTKYTPGVYSEIHIRVQDLKRRYDEGERASERAAHGHNAPATATATQQASGDTDRHPATPSRRG